MREIFPLRYEILYPHPERSGDRAVRTTPIYSRLLKHNAVMGQAHGWERPLWFAPSGSIAEDIPSFSDPNWWTHVGQEARAAAKTVALFEMSSYSKWHVSGPEAAAFLDRINANRLPAAGRMALGLMLNQHGGIVGDLIVARLDSDEFYLVGATPVEDIYHRWMERHVAGFDVSIRSVTAETAALGLTGPASGRLLSNRNSGDGDFSNAAFPFMSWREIEIGNVRCRALRLSYAGEKG